MQVKNDDVISPALRRAFTQFRECTPPARLNRFIRNLFLESLRHRADYPYPAHAIDDLQNLFDLLDKLEDEQN